MTGPEYTDVDAATGRLRAALMTLDDDFDQETIVAALANALDDWAAAKYRCPNGHLVALPPLPDGAGPPDPDRHGNRRYAVNCDRCGERGTVTVPKHGQTILPVGWSPVD